MTDDHSPSTCERPECMTCLTHERQESIIRLETALLELETSPQGAEGMWVDVTVTVDALDVRNVLDLLRE